MYRFMLDHPHVVVGGAALVVVGWIGLFGWWIWHAEESDG